MRGLVSAAVARRNNGEDTTTTTAVGNDPRLAPLDDDKLALLCQQSNSDEKLTLGRSSPWRIGKSSSLRGDKSREFSKGDEKTTPEQQTMMGGDDDDATLATRWSFFHLHQPRRSAIGQLLFVG